jgi:2'-5' RNA ligase
VVLRYDPNDYLKILHAVIAARVHPLGTSSGYLQRYLEDPEKEAKQPYRVHRILKFVSPTIFDSYSPHFTLLRPHSGESKDELTQLFSDTFGRFDNIVLHSISLLVQSAEEENWRIYREFALTQSEQK